MTARLWVLGNLTIDDILLPDGVTAMGQSGGNALYGAIGARFWEESAGAVARIGPDFPSRHLAPFRDAGIELELIEVDRPSIHNWALYETGGTRRFINWLDSGTHLEQSLRPDELPPAVVRAAACHVAPMPLQVQDALVRRLTELGVETISLDPHDEYIGGHEREVLDLLGCVSLFLPSRREAEILFGRDDPEAAGRALAAAGPRVVAIKLGEDGSLVCVAGEAPRHIPAFRVDAVDPTGAGDAYCGGFLAAYVRSRDPVDAACHATVSASFVVCASGAATTLPIDPVEASARLDQLRWSIQPAGSAASVAGGSQ